MRRAVMLPFLTALLFSLVPVSSAPSPLIVAVVRLDPATVELGPAYCVNNTFALSTRIDNVEDLYGFGFEIVWNTTYLEYVGHILKAPVEIYADGVLHEPIMVVTNEVNALEGWYYLAVSSLSPALSFNGSGTAFEITFRVKRQPIEPEPDVGFLIKYTIDDLAGSTACSLGTRCVSPHSTEHCTVTIHTYPEWNIADINGDLKVDIFDVVLGADAYGSTTSDPNWNARCDLVEPYGKIDIFDIVIICLNYGEEYFP